MRRESIRLSCAGSAGQQSKNWGKNTENLSGEAEYAPTVPTATVRLSRRMVKMKKQKEEKTPPPKVERQPEERKNELMLLADNFFEDELRLMLEQP